MFRSVQLLFMQRPSTPTTEAKEELVLKAFSSQMSNQEMKGEGEKVRGFERGSVIYPLSKFQSSETLKLT